MCPQRRRSGSRTRSPLRWAISPSSWRECREVEPSERNDSRGPGDYEGIVRLSHRQTHVSFSIAAENLRANPLRSALSMLGVTIGVASLVAVLSLGDGFERTMREMARADGRIQRVAVTVRASEMIAGQRILLERPPEFTLEDAASLETHLRSALGPGSSIRLHRGGLALIRDDTLSARLRMRGLPVVGLNVPLDSGTRPGLASGRFFLAAELVGHARVAVISDSLAQLLGGGPAALGRALRIGPDSVSIVGMLNPSERDARQPLMVVGPLTIAPGMFAPSMTQNPAAFQIQAPSVELVSRVNEAAEGWLATRFGARWRDSASTQSYAREAAQGAQGILMFKVFMGSIAGISMLVGGIGIMNVLLAAVYERTREIGIRRAVGARGRDIRRQFLVESMLIAGTGASVGTVLGIGIAQLGAYVMRRISAGNIEPGFSVWTLLVVTAAALTVGLAFGSYPALRAAALSPLDAIRHE